MNQKKKKKAKIILLLQNEIKLEFQTKYKHITKKKAYKNIYVGLYHRPI